MASRILLAALLHGARSRAALDALPEAAGLPRPDGVRVAAVDGQFFDATTGKHVPKEDFAAKTIWGWIAWALGGREGYDVVREQDEARVAPGGDEIIKLLKRGPSLILLDELLEYLISAGGVRVEQTTLRDETLSIPQAVDRRGWQRRRRCLGVLIAVEQTRVTRVHKPTPDRGTSCSARGSATRAGRGK